MEVGDVGLADEVLEGHALADAPYHPGLPGPQGQPRRHRRRRVGEADPGVLVEAQLVDHPLHREHLGHRLHHQVGDRELHLEVGGRRDAGVEARLEGAQAHAGEEADPHLLGERLHHLGGVEEPGGDEHLPELPPLGDLLQGGGEVVGPDPPLVDQQPPQGLVGDPGPGLHQHALSKEEGPLGLAGDHAQLSGGAFGGEIPEQHGQRQGTIHLGNIPPSFVVVATLRTP